MTPVDTVRRLCGRARLGWALAAVASGLMGWQMAHPPATQVVDPLPTARPRPPTAGERAAVEAMGEALAHAIAQASKRHGSPLPPSALEDFDDSGTPWLPEGLPDNPLTPAVAWVWEGCPDQAAPVPAPDWVFCTRDQTLYAGGLPKSPIWSTRPTAPGGVPPAQGSGNP